MASLGQVEALDQRDDARFATATCTNQSDNLVLLHLEGDVLGHLHILLRRVLEVYPAQLNLTDNLVIGDLLATRAVDEGHMLHNLHQFLRSTTHLE